MHLLKPFSRPILATTLLILTGCAGMPRIQPTLTAASPLADVVLPDLVLGKDSKNDPMLKPDAKADKFKESADLQSFCLPKALSRFGSDFIDANDSKAFDEVMTQGTEVAKRRHDWNFEAAKLNKQIDLLNNFLNGRGGAGLTPDKLNALRMEEEAYQRWRIKINEARQNSKDGNLNPAQQRQLQSEFPNFRMGRTSLHLVPAATDGVKRNQVILQKRDILLREDEKWYVDHLNAIYTSALKKQLSAPPSAVSLEQFARFDVFRSYSIFACISRVASTEKADATLEAIEPDYNKYAKNVVLPRLSEVYKKLASVNSSDELRQALSKQLPTQNLSVIAFSDPEFSKKINTLMSALQQKEEAALAEKRRRASEAVAAAQKRQKDAFRQKAAKNVLPSNDELLQAWVDRIFSNTQRLSGNFAHKLVRDDAASFSGHVNIMFAIVKASSTRFQINNVACSPSSGRLLCTWSSTTTFTDYGFVSDNVYSKTHQQKEEFAWTDDGLKCLSACSTYIGMSRSYGGSSSGSSSSSSGGGQGASMADEHMQREQENRQRYYDRQQAQPAGSQNRPYDSTRPY